MFKKIKEKIKYYLWSSYRRKLLDKLQEKYVYFYKGIVLDIGGRDRGAFKKPKEKVDKWIFADIEYEHKPDMIIDVADMKDIQDKSIDVINALELFEHVEKIEDGLKECFRVLKKGGVMLISVPFLCQVHADPFDFQRWTKDKWRLELEKNKFRIEKIEIMGNYFFVLADMLKNLNKSLPGLIKIIFYLFYPLLDLLIKLDNLKYFKKSSLEKYHGGYFIVARK